MTWIQADAELSVTQCGYKSMVCVKGGKRRI
jgi:hypothetical protein